MFETVFVVVLVVAWLVYDLIIKASPPSTLDYFAPLLGVAICLWNAISCLQAKGSLTLHFSDDGLVIDDGGATTNVRRDLVGHTLLVFYREGNDDYEELKQLDDVWKAESLHVYTNDGKLAARVDVEGASTDDKRTLFSFLHGHGLYQTKEA